MYICICTCIHLLTYTIYTHIHAEVCVHRFICTDTIACLLYRITSYLGGFGVSSQCLCAGLPRAIRVEHQKAPPPQKKAEA